MGGAPRPACSSNRRGVPRAGGAGGQGAGRRGRRGSGPKGPGTEGRGGSRRASAAGRAAGAGPRLDGGVPLQPRRTRSRPVRCGTGRGLGRCRSVARRRARQINQKHGSLQGWRPDVHALQSGIRAFAGSCSPRRACRAMACRPPSDRTPRFWHNNPGAGAAARPLISYEARFLPIILFHISLCSYATAGSSLSRAT